ncbi:hypothetical protein [Palaeococcus sp. (in: euryarchaeotes)]
MLKGRKRSEKRAGLYGIWGTSKGFSEEAKKKAIEKLFSKISELSREKLTPETLQKLGLYAFAIELIRRNEFDRVNEIKKL